MSTTEEKVFGYRIKVVKSYVVEVDAPSSWEAILDALATVKVGGGHATGVHGEVLAVDEPPLDGFGARSDGGQDD